MQPHILTIPDDTVCAQLLQLASAAGLHITADGLVSQPDPLAQQWEQRDDSGLPFQPLGKAPN